MTSGTLGTLTTCRDQTCRAPIRMVATAAGRWMPLDRDPDPAGNVELRHDGQRIVAVVLGKGDPGTPDTERWMPHWATCPARQRFKA